MRGIKRFQGKCKVQRVIIDRDEKIATTASAPAVQDAPWMQDVAPSTLSRCGSQEVLPVPLLTNMALALQAAPAVSWV